MMLCYYAECRILFTIMLNVVMMSVIMTSVVIRIVAMLNVVVMSVVPPFYKKCDKNKNKCQRT
jgi:hypothetical protein